MFMIKLIFFDRLL